MLKKLALLSVLMLGYAFAQLPEMKIVSQPEIAPEERIVRKDRNGEYCAAIKVQSNLKGLAYESGNGHVGDILRQPGVDMVYLATSERWLRILHSEHKELRIILADMGIQLKPGECWKIEIQGQASTGDLLPVTIFAQPADAIINVDGKQAQSGKPIELSKGGHRLHIEKQGYKTLDEPIQVSKDNVVFNKTIQEVDLQQVQIKSTPIEAQIIIDGVNKDLTDRGLFLYPASYQLKLQKTGYVEVNEMITVREGAANVFSYNLVRNIGTLQFTVTPTDAQVLINNTNYSGKSQAELEHGQYKIQVSKTGYITQEETITIELGKTLRKSFNLIKNSATLTLSVNPADAQVLINKESYSGKTSVELAPGQYKIEIIKEGYNGQSETISIARGETLRKTYALTAKTGKLQFNVQPLEAKVTLKRDGRIVETWQGMKLMNNLTIGDYEIECTAGGYKTLKKTLVISENKTVTLDLTMEKGSDALEGFVYVEGGSFQMGSNDSDEKPLHTVTISSFYISKYEVTQKEWVAVIGNNPSYFKGDNLPVENVSWNDVQEYIRKLNAKTGGNYRLPTEAEWEYAARGGKLSRGYKYSGSDNADAVAWYDGNSGSKTHAVGQKQPNELGLYDMSGNVWEWCQDWYSDNYYSSSPTNNPQGPSTGSDRVLRGGSWDAIARGVRVALRFWFGPDIRYGGLGFRLVRTQ